MRRSFLSLPLLVMLIGASCATLTPQGAQVSVYHAPLDGPEANRAMPDGCKRLSATPKLWMSEQDIEGQSYPFAKQQNATAAEGGNVALVLKKMVTPRRNTECPNAVPIRDCPGYSGAWFDVVVLSYTCTPDAIRVLNTAK